MPQPAVHQLITARGYGIRGGVICGAPGWQSATVDLLNRRASVERPSCPGCLTLLALDWATLS